jgi:thiamine-phosphate pyrophosphorylase
LTGIGEIKDVLDELKPDRIVGAGGLGSRHDAMVAAEAGADYVMFGEPDSQGRRPGLDAICERVKWWADLFETPCVGYAADEKEASALAAAGADFVAVGEFVVNGAQPAATIRTVARMLSSSETVS